MPLDKQELKRKTGVPKGTFRNKPGSIPKPNIPAVDQMGGSAFEDHYRRALMEDARKANVKMRLANRPKW